MKRTALCIICFLCAAILPVQAAGESKYDISEYTGSGLYRIYDVTDTEYGALLYLELVGAPHRTGPALVLVRENGESVNLSAPVRRETPTAKPAQRDIRLLANGRYITFRVSFKERSAGEIAGDGTYTVLHEAGTYYYKADLKTGITTEIGFQAAPLYPHIRFGLRQKARNDFL